MLLGDKIHLNAKIFSMITICLLAISLLTTAGNIAWAMNEKNTTAVEKTPFPDQPSTEPQNSKTPRQIEIDLNDGVSVNTNDPQSGGHKDNQQSQNPTVHQQIVLSEKLAISVNKPDQDMIVLVKQNSDNLTTLERITGIERLRFDGRKLVEEKNGPNLSDQNQFNVISYAQNKIQSINVIPIHDIESNLISFIQKSQSTLELKLDSFSTSIQHRLHLISYNSHILADDLTGLAHSAADLKNPTLFVMLVPLSGYILLRSEEIEITFYKSKRFVSFTLFVILVSSTAIGPISVSPSFMAYAYSQANESNTSVKISKQDLTQSTLNLNGYSNSTQSTLNLNGYSNSTQSTLNLNGYSNSTQSYNTPNATQSWSFGNKNNGTKVVGEIGLDNTTNSASLQLEGNGYLTANGSSTKEIKNLTISAWVKPDYSQGSPVFTVISKEKEFALSINNNIPPYKFAQFSVFDGIRWDTVNSTVSIGQNWNNLVATFNGSSIALYVNGTLQSSVPLTNMITISEKGDLATKDSTDLSSNADIVIGAQYDSTRKAASSQFSGLISNVNLYDSLLNPFQIQSLYNQNLASFYPQLSLTQTKSISSNSTLAEALAVLDNVSLNYTSNINMTNSTLLNYTVSASSLSLNATKSSYKLTDNPELNFQYVNDTTYAKLAKIVKAQKEKSQSGAWQSSKESITIKVLDPHGIPIQASTTFAKIREGKFDIKISSSRYGKPGLYTAIVELTKNGKKYVSPTQFAWGLVIVNTNKGIYKPGETANLTIVVLNNMGQPVCNSQISMSIISPDLTNTILSSNNGITRDASCGVYYAQYVPSIEGNYTVNVSASTPNGMTHFTTYFLTKNSYAFDIIRTADSKIDPINKPNSFNVKIIIGSFVTAQDLTIKEFVPSVFNVTTDASVQTVGDTKILTWNKDLVGNKTLIQYSYSVPLNFPQLYALGPVQIAYGNEGNFTEARQWFVANDPAGTINQDVTAEADTGTTAAHTLSGTITVGNNQDRILIAGITVKDSTVGSVSSVKIGSTSFTKITAKETSFGGVDNEMWYLKNPPVGSNTVTVTLTGTKSDTMILGLISLYGVDQTTTIGTPVTATGNSKTPSISVTTVNTNSWIVDSLSHAGSGGAQTTGATQGSPLYSGTISTTLEGEGSAATTTTTGTYTSSWLLGSKQQWAEIAVEIIPSGRIALTESLSLSDTVSVQKIIHEPITESLSLSDSLSLTKAISTSIQDSLSLVDSASRSKTYKLAMIETLTLTDSITKTHVNLKPLSESLTLTDSITKTHVNLKPLSESLSLNDSVSTSTSITKPLTESLTLTDSVSTSTSITKPLTETLPLIDSVSTSTSITKPLTETLPLSDSVSTSTSITKPLTETLPLIDSVSTSTSITKPLTETLSLNDSVSTSTSITKPLTETLPLIDSVSTSTSITKPLTETLSLNDSVSTSTSITKPLTETLPLSDTAYALQNNIQSLSDFMPLNDAVSISRTTTKSISDTLSLNDSVSTSTSITKPL